LATVPPDLGEVTGADQADHDSHDDRSRPAKCEGAIGGFHEAVALNGLTTIAGFGSLLVAHHRGIQSLGLLLTLGSAASLIASLVVLPALIRLVEPAPEKEDAAAGRNP
jgi:uncharacterized membrane protein YdfJ with MMPL/SSD domain